MRFDKFTDRAKRAILQSRTITEQCGDREVGTQHVLIGLVEEYNGVSGSVFKDLKINAALLYRTLEKITKPAIDTYTFTTKPFSAEVEALVDKAYQQSANLHNNFIGTEHLLLALLSMPSDSMGLILLRQCHAPPPSTIIHMVLTMIGRAPIQELGMESGPNIISEWGAIIVAPQNCGAAYVCSCFQIISCQPVLL